MFGWLAAQSDFVGACKKGESESDPHSDEDALHVCNVFRPICSKHVQLILVKDDSLGLVRFYVALVYAVYRGSLAKVRGMPRKMKVTKALGINAPAESVARVMALEAEQISQSELVFSSLCQPVLLTPVQDIVCELTWHSCQENKGKFFVEIPPFCANLIAKMLFESPNFFSKNPCNYPRRRIPSPVGN